MNLPVPTCVCTPVGSVGPVGAEGILRGGICPILLVSLPNLPSLSNELRISLANFSEMFICQKNFLLNLSHLKM